jgi:hypothetical protein
MKRIRSMSFSCGLSLALTAAVLYLGCALIVALAPGTMVDVLGLIVHGLSLEGLAPADGTMSFSGVLIGTLAISGYAFVAGAIFGAFRGWIGGDQ